MEASPSSPGPASAAVEIRLLGDFEVRGQGQPVPIHTLTRQAKSLLAYLLFHPDRDLSLEFLASLFWPEAKEEEGKEKPGRASLRGAIYLLHRVFRPLMAGGDPLIVAGQETVRLQTLPGCLVDVWVLGR